MFFFEAEDGIRGLCLSRGLGDVYRSQFLFLSIAICFRALCSWGCFSKAISVVLYALGIAFV